ncbi:hypothetical protein KKJ04_22155 [Xenorhabdus bovienii]|uniref:hypothetical protein n=1 Tax=Xenorhabdus bovienii TaxID=40576 RepID=UPI0023B250A0|nr:hypothetical protein [Xenorhabdus bovienii]MDE9448135.1 hypothetical protein [Xenorhabdus bovienii]
MSTYQENRIAENWTKINAQEAILASQKKTLIHLEKRTGGLDITQDKNGVFVILPKGAKTEDNWTVGNQKALKITR